MRRGANNPTRYEQLTVRAHALREELHTEIDRILHDICKFKMHVQDSLENYEGLVVDELDQELGTGDEVVSSATVDVGKDMGMAKEKEESPDGENDEDEKDE